MLPTVVSDGWAAVILRPSVRIRSMSSPERGEGLGYCYPEQVSNQCTHPTAQWLRLALVLGTQHPARAQTQEEEATCRAARSTGFSVHESHGRNTASELTEAHKQGGQ